MQSPDVTHSSTVGGSMLLYRLGCDPPLHQKRNAPSLLWLVLFGVTCIDHSFHLCCYTQDLFDSVSAVGEAGQPW